MSALEYDRKRAMKQQEFTKCLLCGEGMAHHLGALAFYRVRLERIGINYQAVRQQQGLEQFFGGGGAAARLAQVMGPDDDIGIPLGEPDIGLVCDHCAIEHPVRIAQLAETINDREEEAAREKAERAAASQRSGVAKNRESAA